MGRTASSPPATTSRPGRPAPVRPRRQRHRRRRRVRRRGRTSSSRTSTDSAARFPSSDTPPRRKSLLDLRPGLHRQGGDGRSVQQGGDRPDPRRRLLPATVPAMFGTWAFARLSARGRSRTCWRRPSTTPVRLPRLTRPAPRRRRPGGGVSARNGRLAAVYLPDHRPPAVGDRVRNLISRHAQEGGRGRRAPRGETRPRGRHPGRHRLVVQGRNRLHDRGFHEEDRRSATPAARSIGPADH